MCFFSAFSKAEGSFGQRCGLPAPSRGTCKARLGRAFETTLWQGASLALWQVSAGKTSKVHALIQGSWRHPRLQLQAFVALGTHEPQPLRAVRRCVCGAGYGVGFRGCSDPGSVGPEPPKSGVGGVRLVLSRERGGGDALGLPDQTRAWGCCCTWCQATSEALTQTKAFRFDSYALAEPTQ